MEKLFVSMMRFSAAMTLFGIDQVQHTMGAMTGSEDVSEAMEAFRKTLDSVTASVIGEMDDNKKETFESMSEASRKTVHRSFDAATMADPREAIRATNDMMQRTAESVSDFMERPEREEDEEAQSASDALSGKSKKKSKSSSSSKS